MNLIVAVDENWGIGYKGDLLCHIPTDLKYFKKVTTGKNIIIGRKTLESFPNKKPLPNRHHFVLTRNVNNVESGENITVCNSFDDLISKISGYDEEDVFVSGGGEIYKMLLPYCKKAYITKINKTFLADTFFPNLDTENGWEMEKNNEFLPINGNDKQEGTRYVDVMKTGEEISFDFLLYKKI